MTKSPSSSVLHGFIQTVVHFCLSAWRSMGAKGLEHRTNKLFFYYIDPEELLLLTGLVSEYDTELCYEVVDWCSKYHQFLSPGRLKKLLKRFDDDSRKRISKFFCLINSSSLARLPTDLAKGVGILLSGKSILPSLSDESLSAFRIRAAFGVGCRADVICEFFAAWKLGLRSEQLKFRASDFSHLGYSKKSVLTALDSLCSAFVLDRGKDKNSHLYLWNNRNAFENVFGIIPPTTPVWCMFSWVKKPTWSCMVSMVAGLLSLSDQLDAADDASRTEIIRKFYTAFKKSVWSGRDILLESIPPDYRSDLNSLTAKFELY